MLLPAERRAISVSSTSFFTPVSRVNNENTNKQIAEEDEIVHKLSEEVKYFKRQHQFLTEKLREKEEYN